MFRKQASLLPDSSCHRPKRRESKRGEEGQREGGKKGERRRKEGESGREGWREGDIQIRNDISLSTSRCNHRFTSLKWVSGASLSRQSNLPSPTPTDVFNVKLIIK